MELIRIILTREIILDAARARLSSIQLLNKKMSSVLRIPTVTYCSTTTRIPLTFVEWATFTFHTVPYIEHDFLGYADLAHSTNVNGIRAVTGQYDAVCRRVKINPILLEEVVLT